MRGPLSEGRLEEVGASPVPTASEAESTTYHKPRLTPAKRKNRNAHEEAKQESTKADARTDLAVEIVDEPRKGGENPTLTRKQEEEEEEVRCLIIKRADAFTDAYAHIEDLPDVLGIRDYGGPVSPFSRGPRSSSRGPRGTPRVRA